MANVVPFHAEQRVVAKPLPLGVRSTIRTPEQESRNAACDLLQSARKGVCTQEQWGEACGADQKLASKWENPDADRMVNLTNLVRAVQSRRGRDVVAAVARGLLALTEGPHAAIDVCARLCSVTSEVGDVAREVIAAKQDGRIDRRECAVVTREIDEAIEALKQLRRDVVEHATRC